MSLTKSHLIDAIAEQNGFSRKKCTESIKTILELIKLTLASGNDFLISGFGKFCVRINGNMVFKNKHSSIIPIFK